MATTATILHADLDAFYASVEQLLDPSYAANPSLSAAELYLPLLTKPKRSESVAACRDDRRASYVHSSLLSVAISGTTNGWAMPPSRSSVISPLVERISIDEAFADVSGCTLLFGTPAQIATAIRRRVRTELGLAISVGVARTKHLGDVAESLLSRRACGCRSRHRIADPARQAVELNVGSGDDEGAAGRDRHLDHRAARQDTGMVARAVARSGGRRETRGAGVELRSRQQTGASPPSAIGRGAVGDWPQACRRAGYRPTLLHLAEFNCYAAPGAVEARSNGDGARPLRRTRCN